MRHCRARRSRPTPTPSSSSWRSTSTTRRWAIRWRWHSRCRLPPHCRPGSRCHRCSAATTPRSSGAPREAGLDLAMFDRFQPWFVATLLLQLELAKRGFDPALGIEQQLAGRAIADRKPIMGLETPAQQFAVLSGLSLADQKRFLLMTLDESAQADAELEQLLAAWRKGDTSAARRAAVRRVRALSAAVPPAHRGPQSRLGRATGRPARRPRRLPGRGRRAAPRRPRQRRRPAAPARPHRHAALTAPALTARIPGIATISNGICGALARLGDRPWRWSHP